MPSTLPGVLEGLLLVEPWDGGSHGRFLDRIEGIAREGGLPIGRLSLPARHWKWRMRGSGFVLGREARRWRTSNGPVRRILASSYLPLSDFLAAAGPLGTPARSAETILYFHENEFAYPSRLEGRAEARDHHYAFTQLMSSLLADRVGFNSEWNRRSFFEGARELMRRMPDARFPEALDRAESNSFVLGLPLDLGCPVSRRPRQRDEGGPLVLWNHRWEHDKGPDLLLAALRAVKDLGLAFRLAICGQRFARAPEEFGRLADEFQDRLVSFGELSTTAYKEILTGADIVLSTARHEFFGISVLEAVHCGAWPLVPDALVYPELYPAEHRYRVGRGPEQDARSLAEALGDLCRRYGEGEALAGRAKIDTRRWDEEAMSAPWRELLGGAPRVRRPTSPDEES